jgi:hypothetical protein
LSPKRDARHLPKKRDYTAQKCADGQPCYEQSKDILAF